jgi:hypothetical protein
MSDQAQLPRPFRLNKCEECFQLRVIAHIAVKQIGRRAEFAEQRTHILFGAWAPIGQHEFRTSPAEGQGGAITDFIGSLHHWLTFKLDG